MGKKMEQASKDIIEALEAEAVVCLSSHEHADGDSLGSLLGLAIVLRGRGCKVLPALPRDAEVPPQYSFLPGQEMLVSMADLPGEPALFMALDCGNLTRLDGLQDKATAAAVLVNIDHHEDNTAFGRHNLVDMFASSTSELVFRLVRDAGWKICPEAAKCFYTGLVTDTGRFRHQNTSSEAMRAAADLVELGAEPAEVVANIYERVSLPYLRLTGTVLERASFHDAFPLVYSYLTQDDLKRTGVEMGETEDLIDQLRVVGGADAVLLLKEQADGKVRASLRSRDDLSVGLVARAFGGGGHARAAGFTADAAMEEVVEMVVKAILEQAPGTGAA